MTTHRILILGGGFGGVYAARRLDQIFAHRDDVEITLLSGDNFLLFTPMLAEVVSSSIEASHIISPIRAFFRRVRFQNSEVKSIDLERRVWRRRPIASCADRASFRSIIWFSLWARRRSSTGFRGSPRTLCP